MNSSGRYCMFSGLALALVIALSGGAGASGANGQSSQISSSTTVTKQQIDTLIKDVNWLYIEVAELKDQTRNSLNQQLAQQLGPAPQIIHDDAQANANIEALSQQLKSLTETVTTISSSLNGLKPIQRTDPFPMLIATMWITFVTFSLGWYLSRRADDILSACNAFKAQLANTAANVPGSVPPGPAHVQMAPVDPTTTVMAQGLVDLQIRLPGVVRQAMAEGLDEVRRQLDALAAQSRAIAAPVPAQATLEPHSGFAEATRGFAGASDLTAAPSSGNLDITGRVRTPSKAATAHPELTPPRTQNPGDLLVAYNDVLTTNFVLLTKLKETFEAIWTKRSAGQLIADDIEPAAGMVDGFLFVRTPGSEPDSAIAFGLLVPGPNFFKLRSALNNPQARDQTFEGVFTVRSSHRDWLIKPAKARLDGTRMEVLETGELEWNQ